MKRVAVFCAFEEVGISWPHESPWPDEPGAAEVLSGRAKDWDYIIGEVRGTRLHTSEQGALIFVMNGMQAVGVFLSSNASVTEITDETRTSYTGSADVFGGGAAGRVGVRRPAGQDSRG